MKKLAVLSLTVALAVSQASTEFPPVIIDSSAPIFGWFAAFFGIK